MQFFDECGGLAQMVERSLSMREVPGSIPGFSNATFFTFVSFFLSFFFPASVFRIVVCLLKTGFLGGRVSLLQTLQEMILLLPSCDSWLKLATFS